jgi:predicted peptidase
LRRFAILFALALLAPLAGCRDRGPVQIPEPAELKKLPPGTHQETADVPGVGAVKYTIKVPADYDGKTPVPLVLALHYGYDGSRPKDYTGRGMIDAFESGLSGLNAIVIAPDALGGDWKDASNEKAAVWLTKSAMKTYAVDEKKVVIMGFSLGGEGAWFIGSRHQDVFTGAIPVAAPVAGGKADWKIPVYVIHSDKDKVVSYSSAKSNAESLKSKGAKVEFRSVSGLDHYQTGAYAQYVGDGVKWLQAQWK